MARRGFTLLELLMVVAVLAVLAGLTFGLMNVIESKKIGLTEDRIHTIKCKVQEYRLVKGYLPAKLEDLSKSMDQPAWMKDGKFVDVWERPLEYRVSGQEFKLWSCGLDGVSGTPDDLESVKN